MKLQYLGHSAYYLEEGEIKALIDPFLRGNPQCPVAVEDFEKLTHIFVTHGHGDHLGDTLTLARRYGAKVLSNFEIIHYLEKKGLTNLHSMHIGGRVNLDGMTIKMTPAVHGSGIEENGDLLDGGMPGGFVIKIGEKSLYHAGDTGLTYDMKLLEEEKLDVALLPIGGNYTMDVADALRAVDFIKPSLAIPMHYDTFPVITAKATDFAKKASCKVALLSPGQVHEF